MLMSPDHFLICTVGGDARLGSIGICLSMSGGPCSLSVKFDGEGLEVTAA